MHNAHYTELLLTYVENLKIHIQGSSIVSSYLVS